MALAMALNADAATSISCCTEPPIQQHHCISWQWCHQHAMLPSPLPMPASTAAEIKCCSTVRKAKWQWQQQWQQLHADPLQHSRLFFNLKNVLNMIFSYAICYHYLPHCGKSLVCWTGDTFSRGDAPLALCLKLIACFYKKYFFAKLNFKLGTG